MMRFTELSLAVPEYYNIGVDVCDKWADERYRLALIYEDEDGKIRKIHLLGYQGALQPPGQCPEGLRHRPGGPGGDPSPPVPGNGDRPCRHLQTGRHRDSAVHPLRPRCPGVSSGQQRGQSGHHRRGQCREDPADREQASPPEAHHRHQGKARGRRPSISGNRWKRVPPTSNR